MKELQNKELQQVFGGLSDDRSEEGLCGTGPNGQPQTWTAPPPVDASQL